MQKRLKRRNAEMQTSLKRQTCRSEAQKRADTQRCRNADTRKCRNADAQMCRKRRDVSRQSHLSARRLMLELRWPVPIPVMGAEAWKKLKEDAQ